MSLTHFFFFCPAATVRKLGRPPPLIMRIMDCVLILFQRRLQPIIYDPATVSLKPSWNESLKVGFFYLGLCIESGEDTEQVFLCLLLIDDGEHDVPAAAAELPQGLDHGRDHRVPGALFAFGRLQHGYGHSRVRRRGRSALLDASHGLLLRRQQRSPPAQSIQLFHSQPYQLDITSITSEIYRHLTRV